MKWYIAGRSMIMLCPNCKNEISANDQFCIYCGEKIVHMTSRTEDNPFVSVYDDGAPDSADFFNADPSNDQAPDQASDQAPVPPPMQETPGQKKKGKLPLFLILAIAAVLIIGLGVFAATRLIRSPKQRFLEAQIGLINEKTKNLSTLASRNSKGYSGDLILTGSVSGYGMDSYNSYLDGSSLTMKVDSTDKSALVNLDLEIMGSNVMGLDVFFDNKNGDVLFTLPGIDDTLYSTDIVSFYRNVLDQEIDLKTLENGQVDPKFVAAEGLKYGTVIYKGISNDNIQVEKKQEVSPKGVSGTYNCTVYKYVPTKEEISSICVSLADTLEKDKELADFLDSYSDYLLMLDPYDDTYQELHEQGGAAFLKTLADSFRQNADYYGEEFERAGFTWSVAQEGRTVREIRITAEGMDGLVYSLGGSDRREEYLGLVPDDYYNGMTILDTFTENGKSRSGDMAFTIEGQTMDLIYDMPDPSNLSKLGVPFGTYDLSFAGGDSYYPSFAMQVEKSGSDSVYNINCAEGDTSIDLALTATEKSTAVKPSGSAVDISGYTADDYSALVNTLSSKIYDLIYELF